MATDETPKRLTPASAVTRALYLASGNRCAFPGCRQVIMGVDGVLVGEICHIEAALPDGPRFNGDMTNEGRRALDNLILMCANHHTTIDEDVKTWDVVALRAAKVEHERIYTGAVDRLREQVADITEGAAWTSPRNLKRLQGMTELDDQDVTDSIRVVEQFAARLASVPLSARSILAIILYRGKVATHAGAWDAEAKIPMALLDNVVDCSKSELGEYTEILRHCGLLWIGEDPYDKADAWTYFVGNSTGSLGWPLLADIVQAASGDPSFIRNVIEDLNFAALDT